jgi:hypothetical protein
MLLQKVNITSRIKAILKENTSTQGGQWIEKKNMRLSEATAKASLGFNPKAARTRSF